MPYSLIDSQLISNSREPLLMGPLNSAELMIKLTNTAVSGVLERFGGEVFSFRWESAGKIGRKQQLYFGETEHFLDAPQSGQHWLKIFPSRYIFNFSIEVYEMELDTDLTALALKTGLSESFLKLQSSQIIQLLIGIDNMPSADTRNLIKSIEATSEAIASGKADHEATKATTMAYLDSVSTAQERTRLSAFETAVETAKINENMVVSKSIKLPADSFVLQLDGSYHSVFNLEFLNTDSVTPQISVSDSQGDDQGMAQVINPYQSDSFRAAIELSASQKADTAFPLKVIVQGVQQLDPKVVMPAARMKGFSHSSNPSYFYRLNELGAGIIQRAEDNPYAPPAWDEFGGLTGIIEAYLGADGVFCMTGDGFEKILYANGALANLSESEYFALSTSPGGQKI